MAELRTFGGVVSQARKTKSMTQKQLTELIKRENGESISPQYMNDIEHDRRLPSSDVIVQIAKALDLNADSLHFLAGKWPGDLSPQNVSSKKVEELMIAFRKTVGAAGR